MRKSKLFVSSLVYFIAMITLVVFYIVIAKVDLSFLDEMGYDIFTTLIIQIVIILLLPFVLYTIIKKKSVKRTFAEFNFAKISIKTLLYSIVVGVCCYFLNVLVASLFSNIIVLFGYETIPSYSTMGGGTTLTEFLVSLVLVAVLPAICEEVTHRGLLLGGFSRLGLKASVILSSLLFGLLHLNINQFFYATVLGFLMAVAVIMTKSIFPAMIIHFCNNGLSLYFAFAQEKGLFGSKITAMFENFLTGSNAFTAFIGSFVIMTGLVLIIVVCYIMLLRENRMKKMKKLLKDVSSANPNEKDREKLARINPKANPFSNTYLNNLKEIKSLLVQYNITSEQEMIFKKEEREYHKPLPMEKVFIISSIVLGAIVTIFTFVWGIL